MPILGLLLGGISLIGMVAGLGIQKAGIDQQVAAAQQASQASQATEKLRQQQMMLEASRQQRQTVRNALAARSQALVSAGASGASLDSSGIQGGLGQISGQKAENQLGISQGTQIGSGIFDNNAIVSRAGAAEAAGRGLANFGGGLTSLSQSISGLKIG